MRVLIVDDELNLEIASIIIESMGHTVIGATDGNEGYNLTLKEMPDLILMDYHLPGIDGITTTGKIKSNDAISHIPIIALTADIYAQQDFMNAGCNAYLAKPIRKASLLRIVTQVLAADPA